MEKRIIFRVSDEMYEKVNEAVKQGNAKTISELGRAALSEFLTKFQASKLAKASERTRKKLWTQIPSTQRS